VRRHGRRVPAGARFGGQPAIPASSSSSCGQANERRPACALRKPLAFRSLISYLLKNQIEAEMDRINQAMRALRMVLLAFFFALVVLGCKGSSSSGADAAPSVGAIAVGADAAPSVKANAVVGTWVGTASTRHGSMTLTFKSDMTGMSTWTNPNGIERSFTYTINGSNITWSQQPNDPIDCGGATQTISVSATINGSTMTGSFTAPAVGKCAAGSGTFKATKQ